MNKQTQTQVRVLAEDFASHAHDRVITTMVGLNPGDDAYGTMVGSFEIARQVALLVEEMKAQRLMLERLLTKGGRDE